MAEKYVSINEAHRLTRVALSTLRRKIDAGELKRVEGKGITLASLQRLYGDKLTDEREGGKRSPSRQGEREGIATPIERGSAPRSERVSTPPSRGVALPPDHSAELAALRAERDTLKSTLDHERADREKERAAWGEKYELLAKSLITTKGADAVRDIAEIRRLEERADIIDGEASTGRDGNPQNPPGAGRGAKQTSHKTESDQAPRPAPGGFWGFVARFRR